MGREELGRAKLMTLTFGAHEGQTLEQIERQHPEYIDWLTHMKCEFVRVDSGRKWADARRAAQEIVDGR